jgi:Mrp family chromosome partitioning ATPase
MLESLREGESQRVVSREAVVVNPPAPPRPPERPPEEPIQRADEAGAEPEAEDFVFIEVGAPGKKIEGSAAVLATPEPVRSASQLKSPSAPAAVAAPTLSEPKHMTAAFEPCPAPEAIRPRIVPEVVTYHHPQHPVSKQYGALLEQMRATLAEYRSPALLFTGAAPRAGTTTVLLNLAFSPAAKGKRLIVVEGNLPRPALAERLGLEKVSGLDQVLAGKASLEKAIHPVVAPGVHVLPTTVNPRVMQAMGPEVWRWVLGCLRDRFDLILIDAPDVEAIPESAGLMSSCDGVYLVLPATTKASADSTALGQAITHMGGRLRGLIHTQLDS